MKKKPATKLYNRPFLGRTEDMLRSKVFFALGLTDLRILARAEIEHIAHAGKDNGRLPVTFQDLVDYGVKRKLIPRSLRRLAALGFIEVTRKGRAENREFRHPSLLRLTYAHTVVGGKFIPPTNEWKRFTTAEEMTAALANAEKGPRHDDKKKTPKPSRRWSKG